MSSGLYYLQKLRTFEAKQSVHISDIPQVLFPSASRAYAFLPTLDEFQNPLHDWSRKWRRAFGEAADKFI